MVEFVTYVFSSDLIVYLNWSLSFIFYSNVIGYFELLMFYSLSFKICSNLTGHFEL